MKIMATICMNLLAFTSFAWESAPVVIKTEWGERVTPENALREYPRPQFVRSGDWQNLNGLWDYAVVTEDDDFEVLSGPVRGPKKFDGKILVPFAIETSLSGVGRNLESHEHLWYSRTITVEPKKGCRTLLNFEAVDFRAQVFLNGVEVTDVPHEGMNIPFTIDITPFARKGENLLQVCVWDPTNAFIGSVGKQSFKPHSCFYSRSSGITGTVWMETVPKDYIMDWTTETDIAAGTVKFAFETATRRDAPVDVEVRRGGKVVARGKGGKAIKLPKPIALWSPGEPNLYDVTFTWGTDRVESYFAMREFKLARDANGTLRFALNGKIVFLQGTLDQGWWPESFLTPPSDEAMKFDIQLLKDCGFNMMRKHIKVEPRRYYALCDKMGILVLQDMPSGGGDRVHRYGFYRRELKEMIDHLRNVPSIVMWVPYNESWGMPGAKYVIDTLAWVKRYDPSRLVDGPSGWNDYEGGAWYDKGNVVRWESPLKGNAPLASDAVDLHEYPGPGMHKGNRERANFLGEFGGNGLRVEGHLWLPGGRNWGYASDADPAKSFERYEGMMRTLASLARCGLAGSVYTQTTDVEEETNGLATYDRKVVKYDIAKLRKLHEAVYRAAEEGAASATRFERVEFVAKRDMWRYAFDKPADGWQMAEFDDTAWKAGKGGFGNEMVNQPRGVDWTTNDLWLRKTFDCASADVPDATLELFHDEDVEIYLNGALLFEARGYVTAWEKHPLDTTAVRNALRKGQNVLSVHVRQTTGGQYFDMALSATMKQD